MSNASQAARVDERGHSGRSPAGRYYNERSRSSNLVRMGRQKRTKPKYVSDHPLLKSTKTALRGPTAPPVGGGVRAYITGRVRSRAPAGSLSSVHNGRSGGADAENPLGLPHRSTAAEARQPLNLMRYRNHVGSGMRPLRAAFTAEPDRGRIRSHRVPPTCDGPNFGGR